MALDLTRQVPRSPFERLEGFAWLPRLIDKARATYAGTNGDYSPYPCPGDRAFLRYFGIDALELGRLIQNDASDEDIAAYVQRTTRRTEVEKAAFYAGFFQPPRNPVMRFVFGLFIRRSLSRLRRLRPNAETSGIDTLQKLLAFEEGHALPPAPARA